MKVAVIQGGPSAEAEVSRTSAAGVTAALQKAGHEPKRLELRAELPKALQAESFDVVFPVTHGKLGEDGALQGLLEVLGMPYVGSAVTACALAADKILAKQAFAAAGLPLAAQLVLRAGTPTEQMMQRVRTSLGSSVVVKPASQGSAIGVSLVPNAADDQALHAALENALRYDSVLLCERLVRGREVTCGVLDVDLLGGLQAFPPTEIFSKAASWYDFNSRYAKGGSVHQCPADLPASVTQRVQQVACAAHQALGCRDLCRVDFVVGDGEDKEAVTLLEVNVIPGMTATSLYPEAAAAAGYRFEQLCDALVRQALHRALVHPSVQALPMP